MDIDKVFNGDVPRFKGESTTVQGDIFRGAGCYTDVHGKPYIVDEGDGDLPVFYRVKQIEFDTDYKENN